MPSFVKISKILISVVFYDHDFLLLYFYYSNFPTKSLPQIPGKFLFLDSSICPISWIFTGSPSCPTWSRHNILVKSITFSFLTIQLMLVWKDSLSIFYLRIIYLIISPHLYYFFNLSGDVLFPEIFQTLDQWRLHLCLRKDRQTEVHCVPALWQWTSVNFPGVQFICFPLRSQCNWKWWHQVETFPFSFGIWAKILFYSLMKIFQWGK